MVSGENRPNRRSAEAPFDSSAAEATVVKPAALAVSNTVLEVLPSVSGVKY